MKNVFPIKAERLGFIKEQFCVSAAASSVVVVKGKEVRKEAEAPTHHDMRARQQCLILLICNNFFLDTFFRSFHSVSRKCNKLNSEHVWKFIKFIFQMISHRFCHLRCARRKIIQFESGSFFHLIINIVMLKTYSFLYSISKLKYLWEIFWFRVVSFNSTGSHKTFVFFSQASRVEKFHLGFYFASKPSFLWSFLFFCVWTHVYSLVILIAKEGSVIKWWTRFD